MLKLFQIIIFCIAFYPVISNSAVLRVTQEVSDRVTRSGDYRTAVPHVYRVEPKAVSAQQFEIFRTVVGAPAKTEFDEKREGYVYETGETRIGAFFHSTRGRYVCFRENKCDFTSESVFPQNLNERAKTIVAGFTDGDGEYIPTAMNTHVLQEPGGGAPREFKRTYIFNRRISGRTVLSEEGCISVQFNRKGEVAYIEAPSVDLTPVALSDQIDPRLIEERFDVLARMLDTLQLGARVIHIDSIVVDAIASTYIQEERDGVVYLVPYQTARLLLVSSEGERIQRERHFSLDVQSRRFTPVDPWLQNR